MYGHVVSLAEHTFVFKGVCKIGTNSSHLRHKFQISADPVAAPNPCSSASTPSPEAFGLVSALAPSRDGL